MYNLTQLGLKHVQHAFVEKLYLTTGFDITKPITFYAIINERCNLKCQHCDYWRLEQYQEELSTEQWQKSLLSIRQLVGRYSINFSGGEPFLRKDMIDILRFCHEHGIQSGVTTNGSTLTENNAKKLVAAHPFNVNISCDAPNREVHDVFRGVPGSFDKLSQGIEFLFKEKSTQRVKFPIIIKTTINALNLHLLEEQVEWVQKIGANAVSFQPLEHWTPETHSHLWIGTELWPQLKEVVDRLIEMKRRGASILNDENSLRMIVPYYRGEKTAKVTEKNMTCLTGLRNYFIRPNGDVQVCYHFPKVGNIRAQNARDIWRGIPGKEIRKATTRCNKSCLTTCLYQKSLKDKVKQAVKLLAKR